MTPGEPLTFLSASKLLAGHNGGETIGMSLRMSGLAQPLELFLKAEALRHGRTLALAASDFGVFQQFLATPPAHPTSGNVFLCCPWDFWEPLDWRRGVPPDECGLQEVVDATHAKLALIQRHAPVAVFYLDAELPPISLSVRKSGAISAAIREAVVAAHGRKLGPTFFSLASYLANGCPIAGSHLGLAAQAILEPLLAKKRDTKKLLVTDLDDTLWSGIVGEDGIEALQQSDSGPGYKHFVYQSYLRKLSRGGVLLAAVTRNDVATVEAALSGNDAAIQKDSFVAVIAGYQAKSAQIRNLVSELNLSLDQAVFVDDNSVEIAEVSRALPEVECIRFPASEDGMPAFLARLGDAFSREEVTAEDAERAELYRRRAKFSDAAKAAPEDVSGFLRSLNMQLTVRTRSRATQTRALQLINKTNQFNLNGRRWDPSETADLVDAGWQLFAGTLGDKFGEHGETVAMLVDRDAVVRAFVMSCRVFQRNVEFAFVDRVAAWIGRDLRFDYAQTKKNEPTGSFFGECEAVSGADGLLSLERCRFAERFAEKIGTIRVISEERENE